MNIGSRADWYAAAFLFLLAGGMFAYLAFEVRGIAEYTKEVAAEFAVK